MADLLRIASKDQTDTINVLTGTYKLENLSRHYPFLEGADGIRLLRDKFPLLGVDTVANLNTAQVALEKMIEKANLWHRDKLISQSYWLEWNVDGENAKRSLIMSGATVGQTLAPGVTPQSNQDNKRRLDLSLTRHPVFETIASNTDTNTAIGVLAQTVTEVSLNNGTRPGRIVELTVDQVTATGSITTIWAGIRPYYQLNPTNFTPNWALVDGTAGTDTTTATDSTGSKAGLNNILTVSFSTEAGPASRVLVSIGDIIGSSYEHMQGRYLVLLRYKAGTANDVFGLQLRYGYSFNTFKEAKAPVYVTPATNSKWYLADLGIVTFPPGHIRDAGDFNYDNAKVSVYVERVDGSGTLKLDCLMFIPADHFMKVDDANITNESTFHYYCHEDDQSSAVVSRAGSAYQSLVPGSTNFYVPIVPNPGGFLVVVTALADYESVETDTIDVSVEHVERWKSYRTS